MKELLLLGVVLFLLWQFGFWVLFGRLGIARWISLIPGYNLYRFCQQVYGKGSYWLFFLLPLGSLFFWIYSLRYVSNGFRKSNAFFLGILFLFPLVVCFLPTNTLFRKRFVRLRLLYIGVGIFSVIGCVGSVYALNQGYLPAVTAIYAPHTNSPQVELSNVDITTHPAFSMKTIEKGVTMPILKGSTLGERQATFTESGLTVSITMKKNGTGSLTKRLHKLSETKKEELLAAGFVNPVVGDMYGNMTNESEVMCQINYETAEGGKQYQMFRLTQQDSFTVLVNVTYDSTAATDATMPLLAEICTVYGMSFQGDMIIHDITKPIQP